MKRQVVAITGGTRGIGLAIAQRFAHGGAAVSVCSRSPRPRGLPVLWLHAEAEVRLRSDAERFVEAVIRRFGRLDVLVNCAGISRWCAVEDLDEPFVEDVVQSSLLGTLWGCAAAARRLRRGGCIVNVSSLAGKRGSANNSAYCAAKFAVNGITQALAKELGPRGIRVNAVCPVYVATEAGTPRRRRGVAEGSAEERSSRPTEEILAALAEPAAPPGGRSVRAYLKEFAKTQTALGRLPTATEVAETVVFLAGPAASAITGQCVNVDCGTLPQ